MKITIDTEIDTSEFSANLVGEMLREQVFVGEGYGCYFNFDVAEEFSRVDNGEASFIIARHWWSGHMHEEDLKDILSSCVAYEGPEYNVAWYWDGDGCLLFWKEGDFALINDDCKKSNNWEFIEI